MTASTPRKKTNVTTLICEASAARRVSWPSRHTPPILAATTQRGRRRSRLLAALGVNAEVLVPRRREVFPRQG